MRANFCKLTIPVVSMFLLIVGSRVASFAGDKPTVTVDDVVKAWEARAERNKTLRFQWSEQRVWKRGEALAGGNFGVDPVNPAGQVVPEAPTAFVCKFSFVADGDKLRYEKLDLMLARARLTPQRSVLVVTGEGYRSLQYPDAMEDFYGHIIHDYHIGHSPLNDPNLVPLLVSYRPFHPLFGAFRKFKERFRVIEGNHIVDGRNCILLKTEPWGLMRFRTSLYLDPEREFLVMKKVVDAGGNPSSELTFLKYERLNDEWIPMRWVTTFAKVASDADLSNSPHVTEFAFGETIAPGEFEVEFPPSTLVRESGRPTDYIVKANGEPRTITFNKQFVERTTREKLMETETGTLAKGPDTTDDPSARKEKLAKLRRLQAIALLAADTWYCLVSRDDGVEVRIELAREPKHIRQADVVITEESCRQMLYGKPLSDAEAREILADHLRHKIEAFDRACELTDSQKDKLTTAGRDDIARFFSDADNLRPKIRKLLTVNEVEKGALDELIAAMLKETRTGRKFLESGEFGAESVLAKTLKAVLSPEQAAAYEAAQATEKQPEKK